jgi:hypothetical protein
MSVVGVPPRLGQDAVEGVGPQLRALGQRHVQRAQEFAQHLLLGQRGLVVHPVDQRLTRFSSVSAAATLAWIMHSSISLCASSRAGTTTLSTLPSGVEKDLAFRHVEFKRLARVMFCA